MKVYHILNGDSLYQRFPSSLKGDVIVMRECLIDGNVEGRTIGAFVKNRLKFMKEAYGVEPEVYNQKSVVELNRILEINKDDKIYLWFEHDVFCLLNMAFICHLIVDNDITRHCFYVQSSSSLRLGFAGMSELDLTTSFELSQAIKTRELKSFAELWCAYQISDWKTIEQISNTQLHDYPEVSEALKALLDWKHPDGDGQGIVEQVLIEIIDEHKGASFGEIFKAFSDRAPIYGFGDLQVKRMLNGLSDSNLI